MTALWPYVTPCATPSSWIRSSACTWPQAPGFREGWMGWCSLVPLWASLTAILEKSPTSFVRHPHSRTLPVPTLPFLSFSRMCAASWCSWSLCLSFWLPTVSSWLLGSACGPLQLRRKRLSPAPLTWLWWALPWHSHTHLRAAQILPLSGPWQGGLCFLHHLHTCVEPPYLQCEEPRRQGGFEKMARETFSGTSIVRGIG